MTWADVKTSILAMEVAAPATNDPREVCGASLIFVECDSGSAALLLVHTRV